MFRQNLNDLVPPLSFIQEGICGLPKYPLSQRQATVCVPGFLTQCEFFDSFSPPTLQGSVLKGHSVHSVEREVILTTTTTKKITKMRERLEIGFNLFYKEPFCCEHR